MIEKRFKEIEGLIHTLKQQILVAPRHVVIKEFFPTLNRVSIQFVDKNGNPGEVPKNQQGDHLFPLGYRGDVTESLSPQPGDGGLLFYAGWQYKNGFVLITHSEGGDEAMTYVPTRGGWAG